MFITKNKQENKSPKQVTFNPILSIEFLFSLTLIDDKKVYAIINMYHSSGHPVYPGPGKYDT
jgi:hypothetical protein